MQDLYFHMADELISRLIFNNPLIDDIQEISLDIATRRSALLENNSRLFKEYKKQGYKAEQAEDGKYQFRLTNPNISNCYCKSHTRGRAAKHQNNKFQREVYWLS